MTWPLTVTLDEARSAAILYPEPPAGTESLQLWRTGPSGTRAYVRGWAPPGSAYAPPLTVRDYEAPLGVPLVYEAAALDASGVVLETAEPVTFTVPAAAVDDPWLVDIARPLNSLRVVVERFGEYDYDSPVGVHRVLNRRTPVVTGDASWAYKARLVFCTVDEDARTRARDALGNGVAVLLRTPPEQGVGNAYLAPVSFDEARVSRIAQYAERRFTVECVQVDRPDPSLYVPAVPVAYEAVAERYASYAAVAAAVPSYDALLYDYSAEGSPVVPWPPDDV